MRLFSRKSSSGFSAVELLVTLFVAATFLAAGYQLYNFIITDSGKTRAESSASNGAYGLLRRYSDATTNPCTAFTPVSEQSVAIEGVVDPIVTVAITCPQSATTSLSKVEVAVKYGLGADEMIVKHATYVDKSKGVMLSLGITNGSPLQTITNANCPVTRTMASDARDNRSYWVQKLADGKCWMLTDLVYAGGGTDTYGDVKTLTNTGSGSTTYTVPTYYIPVGSNPVTSPTEPSTATDGGAGDPQYGYLYNWCAARGAQTSTSACMNAATPVPDANISICPANWRLPTGGPSAELHALNSYINGGSTTTDAGLRTTWLAQRSGIYAGGFGSQGTYSYYWGGTQASATNAYYLTFTNTSVTLANSHSKTYGVAVRCVAS